MGMQHTTMNNDRISKYLHSRSVVRWSSTSAKTQHGNSVAQTFSMGFW